MPARGQHIEIVNASRSTSIASSARAARSMLARARGLMFVGDLPQNSGLLIDPCSSIHMFFMRIPLDVLYVDRNDVVVRAQRGIRPWRIGPLHTRSAAYVIELPVGTIERSQTQVGDRLAMRDVPSGVDER